MDLNVRLHHGGNLDDFRKSFPNAPEPIIDLSTGINPNSYPVSSLSPAIFQRLPEPSAVRHLCKLAADFYAAPSPAHLTAAPGTQILLPIVNSLSNPGRAAVLGPTYAEHLRAVEIAGHRGTLVERVADLERADIAIVVNPNNPDGRVLESEQLLPIADELRHRKGILVIDEAFADVVPARISLAPYTDRPNIVVLKSFGKFFGLAGVRLGFAIAHPELSLRIASSLGPWAVSGPALVIGIQALEDKSWAIEARANLAFASARRNELLSRFGFKIIGGTSLFVLTQHRTSQSLFERLGRAGIFVRRFEDHPEWLRWGVIQGNQLKRIEAILNSHSESMLSERT